MSDDIDAGLNLLDRQVLDADGVSVGKVDDLEVTEGDDGRLRVTGLIIGPWALTNRFGGVIGRMFTLLFGDDDATVVPLDLVEKRDTAIHLRARQDDLGLARSEHWVRRHLIGKIPGVDDASGQ
ncbi:MAG: PRC-barrel domain-containing protein [Mycobacteriales bacterium]